MTEPITIYTSTMCPVCHMLREFLTGMNLAYEEINLDFHPVERIKLIIKTKRLSVPQTNLAGEWVFGFDPMEILKQIQSQKKCREND